MIFKVLTRDFFIKKGLFSLFLAPADKLNSFRNMDFFFIFFVIMDLHNMSGLGNLSIMKFHDWKLEEFYEPLQNQVCFCFVFSSIIAHPRRPNNGNTLQGDE